MGKWPLSYLLSRPYALPFPWASQNGWADNWGQSWHQQHRDYLMIICQWWWPKLPQPQPLFLNWFSKLQPAVTDPTLAILGIYEGICCCKVEFSNLTSINFDIHNIWGRRRLTGIFASKIHNITRATIKNKLLHIAGTFPLKFCSHTFTSHHNYLW